MRDGSEALKFLSIVAASAVVVIAAWLTLERGGHISGLGQTQAEGEEQVVAARPAESTGPPTQQAPTYRPSGVAPPVQRLKQEAGTTYKWVDEKGTIHFSDRPGLAGAEKIAVAEVATYNNQLAQPVYRQVQVDNVTERRIITVAQVNQPAQAERIGRGRFRTSAGHVITASAKHMGELLSFEGRVEGGSRCSALHLNGWLTSKSGNRRYFEAVATDVGGGGSRLFESQPVRVNRLKEGWEVSSVTASCQ